MAMVTKIMAELKWKLSGWCLLRSVRAVQSEQTWKILKILKKMGTKMSV